MKARSRPIASMLVLLALAAGAVAFAWFGIERRDAAGAARAGTEARLFAFAPADVERLTVAAKGDVTLLARDGRNWRVEAPVRAAAERSTVDALVDRVANLSRKAVVFAGPRPADLSRYGLAPPRAEVTLALAGGRKPAVLALGDENAFDGTLFVRAGEGPVVLVDGEARWAIERGTFDLREKRLLPFEEGDLARVEVSAPGGGYVLAREAGPGWRLASPEAGPADAAAVARVLSAIRGLRATEFVPDRATTLPADFGRPRFRVVLVDRAGTSRALRIAGARTPPGQPVDRVLRAQVEGSSEVALLAPGAAADLDQPPAALREKRPQPGPTAAPTPSAR